MSSSPAVISFGVTVAHFLAVLLASALKGSLVFAAVYGASRLMRAGDSRLTHLLWLGSIASYLLILVLSLVGPPLLRSAAANPAPAGWLRGSVISVLLPERGAASPLAMAASPGELAPGVLRAYFIAAFWMLGVLAGGARVAAKFLRLRGLNAQGRCLDTRRGERWEPVLRQLMLMVGVSRPVRVLESPRFRVPFASGVFHPLIVLPASARRWSPQRLRAVLLHELRHIRRQDPLTQTAAYLVCSLFWFVPLVWVAHSFMYMEQEKACDRGVVSDGVAPGEYATCLLDFARASHEPAVFAGLYSRNWRRKILAERIRGILEVAAPRQKGGLIFSMAALVVCVLILAGGVRIRQEPWDEQLFQRFVGRWVNEQYSGAYPQPQVTVIRPDYIGEEYSYRDSMRLSAQWTIQVRALWVDELGRTCCQFFSQPIEGIPLNTVTLMRIDREGKVCEMNCAIVADKDSARYPEQIDPLLTKYWIYYREQEERP
jgi:beta-lactamase regulating signal transducer with metallopeptidase domain